MTATTTTSPNSERVRGYGRSAGLKIAIVCLAVVAAAVIVQVGAVRNAIMHGEPADAPASGQEHVLSLKAEQLFDEGETARASALARRALLVKAGDVVAIRTLALIAEEEGNRARARALMAASARWGWRDPTTQWWLFDELLHNGDLEAAVIHGEALVAQGQTPDQVWPVFAALAADPKGRAALLTALQRGQRWRARFYRSLGDVPAAQQEPLGQLMRELAKTPASPRPGDVAPLLDAMLSSGKAAQARELWRSLFWRGPLPMPLIHDGGFENATADAAADTDSVQDGGLFIWRFDPEAEIYIARPPGQTGGKAAHLVRAAGRKRVLAQQGLALDPGDWMLSFAFRGDDRDAAAPLRIGIRCAGTGGAWLTKPFTQPPADGNWRRYALPFQVDEGCAGQNLIIEPVGARAGDPIEVWIDDFAIRPAA